MYFSVPVNISRLGNVNIIVTGSTVTISVELSVNFEGSTNFTVMYGEFPNCDTNTMTSVSGTAGDILPVTLEIESDTVYCSTIFFSQGNLTFQVMGMFRSSKLGSYVLISEAHQVVIIIIS